MEFRKFVERHFYKAVRENYKMNSELRNKLLTGNHPKINIMLDNLAAQVVDAQHKRVKAGKKPWDHVQLAWAVNETTNVFIDGIEMMAKKMYQTEAQKLKEQTEAQREKDMELTLEGNPQAEFAEAGLEIHDKSKTL